MMASQLGIGCSVGVLAGATGYWARLSISSNSEAWPRMGALVDSDSFFPLAPSQMYTSFLAYHAGFPKVKSKARWSTSIAIASSLVGCGWTSRAPATSGFLPRWAMPRRTLLLIMTRCAPQARPQALLQLWLWFD